MIALNITQRLESIALAQRAKHAGHVERAAASIATQPTLDLRSIGLVDPDAVGNGLHVTSSAASQAKRRATVAARRAEGVSTWNDLEL